MSQSSPSLRTPLGRVRGLGSAKDGVHHFIQQRVSAIALAVLLPWFALSILLGTDGSFASVQQWMTSPLNAGGTFLLVATGLFHARLGNQVFIEDYLRKPFTKAVVLLLNTFIPAALVVLAGLSILRIFTTGA
jgi:succinate dehydrogenase / fumarate reductase, membrane anchor subunit